MDVVDRESLIKLIKSQFTKFTGAVGEFISKGDELDVAREQDKINWQLYWIQQYCRSPALSAVALCLLSIGISESCVERSFSAQQFIHSDLRNRMTADLVQAEMRIRCNKPIVEALFSCNITADCTALELSDIEQ